MSPSSSAVSTTEYTRSRWFTAVAILLATAVITIGSTAAMAANAAERTAHEADERASAIAAVGHRVGLGAARVDVGAVRLATARGLALDEIDRADAAAAAAAGKATDATLASLRSATDAVTDELTGGTADDVLVAVYALREAEKATATDVAAWQVAEDARLAAEAAAQAAAAAAAAQAAQAASWSPDEDSSGSSSGSSPAAAPAAPAASGPVADCGPCPGATLVPVVWEGVTYWGCP
ncbi:MAG: hypothetical protein ABWY36_09205 [Leifsonia sp.]